MKNVQSSPVERVIRERRTIRSFSTRPVSEDVLIRLLDAAVWAPYHSKQEPWRFIIFMDEGRQMFSDAVLSTYTPQELQQFGQSATKDYCEDTPVHVCVVVRQGTDRWRNEEALLAAAGLIQNLQLLAWEERIGLVWKTNEYNRDDAFAARIGLNSGERLVGTLHLGYLRDDAASRPVSRKPADQLITWIREEQG
ncbi:nitroreductase [Paenibacillus sp. PCH8]|uniref:nitroreductase family protein n=1 Tax=Paenibacillus sp. PCH8 TaxID=2066524 RepID=UPI000CF9B91D|nr:nitroreductase [Paenibacillus sp. PCH8]PQP82404.1 nitroreductase [Paenibacillus sp. PCH8]